MIRNCITRGRDFMTYIIIIIMVDDTNSCCEPFSMITSIASRWLFHLIGRTQSQAEFCLLLASLVECKNVISWINEIRIGEGKNKVWVWSWIWFDLFSFHINWAAGIAIRTTTQQHPERKKWNQNCCSQNIDLFVIHYS